VSFTSTLPADELAGYVRRLVDTHLPDGRSTSYPLEPVIDEALERLERCFGAIHRKYYSVDGAVRFDHLNGDHMAAFLYLVGNSAWRLHDDDVFPAKTFALNKAMHGLDLFYSVRLPEVFLLVHPVGTVIGHAEYGEDLVVYQNCTIGSDRGSYPRFGNGVILYARSLVLGDCEIGSDVVFGANSFILNTDVPSNSIVVGQHPNTTLVPHSQPVAGRLFGR
jgi:serine O-acetyltransferase